MKLQQCVQSDPDDSHVGHVYHVLPAYAPAHICPQWLAVRYHTLLVMPTTVTKCVCRVSTGVM